MALEVDCPRGHRHTGVATCEACPTGEHSTLSTLYSVTTPLAGCTGCYPGEVQPFQGQGSCQRCSDDGSVDCSDAALLVVQPGYFMPELLTQAALEGMSGASNASSSRRRRLTSDGANDTDTPFPVLASRCPLPANCLGGDAANASGTASCLPGSTGPLCGQCMTAADALGDGATYYRGLNTCLRCPERGQATSIGIYATLLVLVLGAALAYIALGVQAQRLPGAGGAGAGGAGCDGCGCAARRNSMQQPAWQEAIATIGTAIGKRAPTLLKIFLSHGQCLVVFVRYHQVEWPTALYDFMSFVSELPIFNLGIFDEMLPLPCLLSEHTGFYASLVAYTALPVIAAATLLLLALAAAALVALSQRLQRWREVRGGWGGGAAGAWGGGKGGWGGANGCRSMPAVGEPRHAKGIGGGQPRPRRRPSLPSLRACKEADADGESTPLTPTLIELSSALAAPTAAAAKPVAHAEGDALSAAVAEEEDASASRRGEYRPAVPLQVWVQLALGSSQLWELGIWLILLLYPTVSLKALATFDVAELCTSESLTSCTAYLAPDTSQVVGSAAWLPYAMLALLSLVLFRCHPNPSDATRTFLMPSGPFCCPLIPASSFQSLLRLLSLPRALQPRRAARLLHRHPPPRRRALPRQEAHRPAHAVVPAQVRPLRGSSLISSDLP